PCAPGSSNGSVSRRRLSRGRSAGSQKTATSGCTTTPAPPPPGRARRRATTVVRRHRLAERLLTDIIGLEWEKVHREADRWEHAISADVEEKLVELLGDPATCPHGNPIPGSKHAARRTPTVALAKAGIGSVTVARISEKLELSDEGLK